MIPRPADNRARRLDLAYPMEDYQPLANVVWIRTACALHLHVPSEIASAIIAIFSLCPLYRTLLQILLHFASQEPCKLAAGAELEFRAELLQKSLIHVVVICRNDGVVHVYRQQDC